VLQRLLCYCTGIANISGPFWSLGKKNMFSSLNSKIFLCAEPGHITELQQDLWEGHVRWNGMPRADRGPNLFLWSLLYRYLYVRDTRFSSRPGYHGLSRVYSVPPDKCSYITSKADNSHCSLNTDSDSSVLCHVKIPTNT